MSDRPLVHTEDLAAAAHVVDASERAEDVGLCAEAFREWFARTHIAGAEEYEPRSFTAGVLYGLSLGIVAGQESMAPERHDT